MLTLITLITAIAFLSDPDIEELNKALDIQRHAIGGFDAKYYEFEIRPAKETLSMEEWESVLAKLPSDPESIRKLMSGFLDSKKIQFVEVILTVNCRGKKVRNESEILRTKGALDKMKGWPEKSSKRLTIFDGDTLILCGGFYRDVSRKDLGIHKQISLYSDNFTLLFNRGSVLKTVYIPPSASKESLKSKEGEPDTYLLTSKHANIQSVAEFTTKGFVKSISDGSPKVTSVDKQYHPQDFEGVLVPRIKVRYQANDKFVLAAFVDVNKSFSLNLENDDKFFLYPASRGDTIVDCRANKKNPDVYLADRDVDDVKKLSFSKPSERDTQPPPE
jgi:hypothetical protein